METENTTFICPVDWIISAIEDCANDKERIDYLRILVEGAKGNYDYMPEYQSNIKSKRSIFSVMKRNRERRDIIIEKRRNAGRISAEKRDIAKNQEFTQQVLTSVNNSVSDSVSDSVSVSDNNKRNLLSEEKEKERFCFIDFWAYYEKWRYLPDGCNLAWHSTDELMLCEVDEIAGMPEGSKRTAKKQAYFNDNAEHQNRVKTNYQTWRDFWSIATAVKKPTTQFLLDLSQTIENRMQEDKRIVNRVAEEIRKGKQIGNIVSYTNGFLIKTQ